MILEAVILLLGAQLADWSQRTPDHLTVNEPSAALVIPSIDEAARANAEAVAPYSTGAGWVLGTQRQELTAEAAPNSAAANPAQSKVADLSGGLKFSLAGYAPPATPVSVMEESTLGSAYVLSEPAASASPGGDVDVRQLRRRRLRGWLGRQSGSDYGLAYERVKLAPMATPTALGVPSVGIGWRYQRGMERPDRLEYFWARAGKGPAAESNLDVLDTVFRMELGSARAVLITELPMRSLDPERNPNTTGLGDMVVGGKSVVWDGQCTKLSTMFLSYLNTGPVDRGLGTGHVSLEPGVVALHQWSERTFLHGAVNYRIPISGTRGFAGDVLTTSWAVSTVWQDRDDYAWMPVLEFQTHSFLFGAETLPDGAVRRVNGTTALDVLPGSRFSFGSSALGACELGVGGGLRCSDSDWFDSRLMIDLRWLR